MEKAGIVTVKISTSTDNTRETGPEYLSDLGKTLPVGEAVDPQTLLDSLNTGTVCGGESAGLLRVNVRRGKTSSQRVNTGDGATHNAVSYACMNLQSIACGMHSSKLLVHNPQQAMIKTVFYHTEIS